MTPSPTPPPRPAALRPEQRGVARGIGVGVGVTLAVLVLWWSRAGHQMLEDRLRTLGAAAAVLGLWVAAGIADVARRRFFSATAIDAAAVTGGEDPAVAQGNAILTNTLEQAVVALAAYVALALLQDASRMLIVALVALFSVGRALFWAGYPGGAAARAPGFALTFFPSVAGLLVALASALAG